MNPRTNYSEADTATARAFITLFIEHGDLFEFAIDTQRDDREVRGYLMPNEKNDSPSEFGITGINRTEQFQELKSVIEDMDVEILEVEEHIKEDDVIGEYTANVLTARAPSDIDAPWNVPHLLIYGSLNPEVEECCYAAFGQKYEYHNIRNHFVIRGDGLAGDAKTTLHDTVGRSTAFFPEDKRYVQ